MKNLIHRTFFQISLVVGIIFVGILLLFIGITGRLNPTAHTQTLPPPTTPTTFFETGAVQTYTVPAGVTSVKIQAWGAQGGDGAGGLGGKGGYAVGTRAVTAGEILYVNIGNNDSGGMSSGGQGGGGQGGGGGDGGVASDVRVGTTALSGRIIVAGGGGGGGGGGDGHLHENVYGGSGRGYYGGAGGGEYGGRGGSINGEYGGRGGRQNYGGRNGVPIATSIDYGGAGGWRDRYGKWHEIVFSTSGGIGYGGGGGGVAALVSAVGGGGGGGGYYGGGGGGWYPRSGRSGSAIAGSGAGGGGGGGGSSYIGGMIDGSTTPGVKSGNGKVIITTQS